MFVLNQQKNSMNENLDLTRILKNCPQGYYFYTPLCGNVRFLKILPNNEIYVDNSRGNEFSFMKDGTYMKSGECLLFPSFDIRDWSKFTAPWYKKDKFDLKTLKPFDRVLAASMVDGRWVCDFFSHIGKSIRDNSRLYVGTGFGAYDRMIPYNEDTKHLVGTTEEAPEYYRYWED